MYHIKLLVGTSIGALIGAVLFIALFHSPLGMGSDIPELIIGAILGAVVGNTLIRVRLQ